MTVELIVDLLTNIILLMSLSVVYSLFTSETKLSHLNSKLVMGISVSIVGYVIMANAVQTRPGIFFDGRSILMLLSGIYFGITPSIIGGITLSLYRVVMGGDGVIPGILWVIIPGLVGIIWRYARLKNEKIDIRNISTFELYLLLLITQSLMVGMLFFFPNKVPQDVIREIALPLTVFYPIGGFAVSVFMMRLRINYFNSLETKDRAKEYTALFHKSSSYSFLIDPLTSRIMNVNQAAIDRYGYTYEEFTKMTVYDINLYTEEEIKKRQIKAISDNAKYYQTKHILKSKSTIDVEVRSTPITIEGKKYIYSTITDISDRIRDELKYKDVNVKLEATLHSVSEGVISTNIHGDIEIINPIAASYLSTSDKDIGKNISEVVRIYSKDSTEHFKIIYNKVMNSSKSYKSDVPYLLIRNEDDSTMYIDFSLSPISYDNRLRGSIFVFRDVTNQFQQNKQIKYISQHDYLTGLYNRYFLEVEMKRLDTFRQLPITIIHGDINGLKLTNDAFGHAVGDRLIEEISSILKKSTRSEDIISRWGGDEFIILLPQTSYDNAQKVVKRIRDLQQKSMYEIMTPSISIGIATKSDESQDLQGVLIEAETEMYNNKQIDGKLFRKEFLEKISARLNKIHPEFVQHNQNVSRYAKAFGKFLRLNPEDIKTLSNLGLYHDIGWVNIPDEILQKKEDLTEEDREIIGTHTEVGFRIMKSIPELTSLAELILSHHERWDGTGYPSSKKGKAIPYLSRIIALCDAYDMMRNNTVYTPKKTLQEAIDDFESNRGTQFDPVLTDQFIEYIKQNDE